MNGVPPNPTIKAVRWGIEDRSMVRMARWHAWNGSHDSIGNHRAAEGIGL